MNTFLKAASVLMLAALTTACVSDQATSRQDSALLLAAPAPKDDTGWTASNRGQSASVWGDIHTSTLLFARAVKANPSPLNKFNLAGAYENENRIVDALRLYGEVAKEGASSYARTLAPADKRNTRTYSFNLGDAAKQRSQAILQRAAQTPTAATGGAEIVELTPEQAAALDARENPL